MCKGLSIFNDLQLGITHEWWIQPVSNPIWEGYLKYPIASLNGRQSTWRARRKLNRDKTRIKLTSAAQGLGRLQVSLGCVTHKIDKWQKRLHPLFLTLPSIRYVLLHRSYPSHVEHTSKQKVMMPTSWKTMIWLRVCKRVGALWQSTGRRKRRWGRRLGRGALGRTGEKEGGISHQVPLKPGQPPWWTRSVGSEGIHTVRRLVCLRFERICLKTIRRKTSQYGRE